MNTEMNKNNSHHQMQQSTKYRGTYRTHRTAETLHGRAIKTNGDGRLLLHLKEQEEQV